MQRLNVNPVIWMLKVICASGIYLTVLSAQCTNPTLVPSGTYTSGDHSQMDAAALASANFSVSSSATAIFAARDCIELRPGFHATAIGASGPNTFHAWVDTAPSAVSFAPSTSPTTPVAAQVFGFVVSSPSASLLHVFALFNTTSASTAGACYIHYDSVSNLLRLANDASNDWSAGFAPESSAATAYAQNSQCRIEATHTPASTSNNQVTVLVRVTFFPSFLGTKSEYLFALDSTGHSGWKPMGSWTVPGQAGCTYSISPANQNLAGIGGSNTASVTSGSSCGWTATSSDSWITITSGLSGSGNGTVAYSVATNTGPVRTGTVTVAGQSISISQSAVSSTSTVITSNPAGMAVTVDNAVLCTTPCQYNWSANSAHTIQAESTHSTGVGSRLAFSGWSDNLGISHSIVATDPPTTYVANYQTEYLLTTNVNPPLSGIITPPNTWVPSNGGLQIDAHPNSDRTFVAFSGALTGSTTPQSVTMSGPRTVTANFPLTSEVIHAPSRLEANLGAIAIDHYDDNNHSFANDYPQSACPSGLTSMRDCFRGILQALRAQGVTGIRFFFGLCGGFHSTPLQNCGQNWTQVTGPTEIWRQNLGNFFQDVHDAGILNITPTPAHGEWAGVEGYPPSQYLPAAASPSGFACEQTPAVLQYLPGEPFGRVPCHNSLPYNKQSNNDECQGNAG